MIKLESDYGWNDSIKYFNTIEECNEYMKVFKDHWCNIRWKTPVVVPDNTSLTDYEKSRLLKSPKERAESNLSWGFNMERFYGDDKLTNNQITFVNNLVKEITGD